MKRIQRKRSKGWRMPENTVYVGRGTKWGNPYKVGVDGTADECVDKYAKDIDCIQGKLSFLSNDMTDLIGKDLACWCPLDQPCHADVLIDGVNQLIEKPTT